MGLEKPVTIVRAERVESETPRPLGLVDVVGNHSRVSDTTQRRDDVRAGATDGKGTANAVSGISKAVDSQSDNRKGTTLPTLELTEARKMSHTVKKNDSLWKIAADNLKDKTKHGSDIDSYVKQIVEANKEKHPTLAKRPDRIQIGMNLQLPEFKQRSSADARKQSKSEGKLAPEADKNGKPEARISPEAERQEELEEKLAPAEKQEKPEAKVAPEADKQQEKPEAKVAPEAEKKQEKPEAKVAPEAEKQEQKPEAKVAAEAEKQEQKPEAKVAAEAEKQEQKPEAKVAPEAEKQEQKPEAKVAPEAEKQEQKPEAKVAPEGEKQEQKPEAKLAPEAEKQQEKPEAKLAPEAEKQQEKPEAKVAPEVEKQEQKPEANLAPEADKQEEKPEAKVAPEAEQQEQKPEAKVAAEAEKQEAQEKIKPKADSQSKTEEKKLVVEGNELVIPNIQDLIPSAKDILPPGSPWLKDKTAQPAQKPQEVYLPKLPEQKTEGAPSTIPKPADSPEVRFANGVAYKPVDGPQDRGKASFYGDRFHGRKTANGERYDQWGMTVAHKTLPFGTILEVTNPANGKSVILRVNDRGPFVKGRVLDVSTAAAHKLGMVDVGVTSVDYKIIGRGPHRVGPVVPDTPRRRRTR